jgi:ribosomal protein S28E/S33
MTEPISLQPRTEDAISLIGLQARTRSRLPIDLLESVSRRLQFVCLLLIVVSALGTVIAQVAKLETRASLRLSTDLFVWVTALGLFLLARSGKISATRLLDVGLVFEVLVAAAMSLTIVEITWFVDPRPGFGWSPVAVWVVVYPIVVPNTTRRTLIASIAAAATEPMTVLVWSWSGAGELPALNVFVRLAWPNVVAVGLAVVVSRVVYGLGEKLSRARQMGSYKMVELLGRGGMGEVWKATHRMLARDAAIKLIHPDVLGAVDEEGASIMLRRFEREARATAALRSPHTVELYDFGIARDGTFYYVMELLDGLDLQTLVHDHGVQPAERVVKILRQACHSLHEAHRGGLVHRDIKPANIFLCRYGADLDFVKVLDFGIVKQVELDGQPDARLTQVGSVSGTPAFMAPEMALGEGPVDGRADIYALGCVAYWLLTGQIVFEKPSALGMIVAHTHQEPVPVSERTQVPVPEPLERVVMQCLAKKPGDRPQSAHEVARLLGDLGLESDWTDQRASQWWEERMEKS